MIPPPARRESWYLDPLAARQKANVHLELVRRWTAGVTVRNLLKTDLFEEANNGDAILAELDGGQVRAFGMDLNPATVIRAAQRYSSPSPPFLACDARQPALRPASMDVIVSTSTLDHMETAGDFHASLKALAGLLRPDGVLIITMDNLENPLYRPLRWASRRGWLPFRMGYTVSLAGLQRALEMCGFRVVETERLLHNPRMVSTLLFLGLRRLLGRRADAPVAWLLRCFAQLGRTPLRRWTACFVAACARVEGEAGPT